MDLDVEGATICRAATDLEAAMIGGGPGWPGRRQLPLSKATSGKRPRLGIGDNKAKATPSRKCHVHLVFWQPTSVAGFPVRGDDTLFPSSGSSHF